MLIPLLFAQIIVFPLVANMMASSWVNTRRDAELQSAASNLVSTIQQLYLSLNREEMSAGNITQVSTLPPTIESYSYTANGSLTSLGSNSGSVLTLTLILENAGNTATASALLGSNARWGGGIFHSSSLDASINVQKLVNGIIIFSF
jgi:type II secretory pathway pseudopilin PulG